MDAKKKVAIIGLGWLGNQIQDTLNAEDYTVVATRRSPTSDSTIQYDIFNDTVPEEVCDASDVIICIPPFRSEDDKKYALALGNLARSLHSSCRVIYTSSTGVYPKSPGNYSEDFVFNNEQQNELSHAEDELRKVLGDRLMILRLGGLIGIDRHPIKFLSGRRILNGGKDGIALIDGRDVCAIIKELIEKESSNGIYNISYPIKMSKKEYYTKIASKVELPPPIYEVDSTQPRIINNNKARERFVHLFKHSIL